MTDRIYFCWNATAPLRPQARAAAMAAFDVAGNPSSVHAEGRAARRLIEEAREKVAALVGAEPRNVVFTSGGTEANMLALTPASGTDGKVPERLLISAIEHPSVLAGGRFAAAAVESVPATGDGRIDLAALTHALAARKGRRALVSLMLANNETGVVQPVSEAARLIHEAGSVLHVDGVQAAGRIPCDINVLCADLLTLSGHKIGAPKGVGAVVRRDAAVPFPAPLIKGGGQERGARAGTENVAGIAAFGAGAERLPNPTLFALNGRKAETAVIAFDLEGIAVSSGAACSSGKVQPSHVLAAMGVPLELARAAVRVSLGPSTTETEIDRTIQAWIRISSALLKETRGIAA